MFKLEYIIKNINDYSEDELKNFYTKISEQKKDKINKYKNYKRKASSIIAEIIFSELLLKRNIFYDSLNYYKNKYGKTYLKNNNLFFNISHSFDYVISVVSDKEIGIDIEKIRKTPIKVINQFATEIEKKYILSSNNNVEERIFKIYTLKEAYFKMLGLNLNNILNVEFLIQENKVSCSDQSVKVGFINDVEGYVIAYCEKI